MTDSLSDELAAYRAGWRARVPAERQAAMDRHVANPAESGIARTALQVGDRAPAIVLRDQHGTPFDVAILQRQGSVVVTFYRGGWCPFCNLELKAYRAQLPRLAPVGASLVAISPEKLENAVSTAEKHAVTVDIGAGGGSDTPWLIG